ncbi:UNVERIFIED_CONTAM: putative MATE family efflux protein [Acetivibrio alkalicellulosi]
MNNKTNKEKQLLKNDESRSARELFTTLPLGRLMIKNAFPAVASMLFMAIYQVIDAVMVGRRLGPEALASVNVLYPILAVFIGLAVMIGVGGNARLAVLLGAGKAKEASRIFSLIVTLGVGLGIVGSIIVRVFFPQILAILGTSGELGDLAGMYLKTMYPFFTTMILFFILEQSVRNDGHAGMAASVMAGMAILNIILDYVFLFILNMGIEGAALATGISQTIGAIIFIVYFIIKTLKNQCGLSFALPAGGFDVIFAIIMNGSSELFNNLALGVTTFLFNRIIISYVGAIGVAAFSVTQYLLTVGMMVFIGLGNGTQPIISYNYGAQLKGRVHGALVRLFTTSMILGVIFFILMRFQADTLARFFILDHPEAIETTLRVTRIVSWSMIFIPVGIVASVFFTALEKAKKSLVIAICRGFVFTVTGLSVFPPLFGETGIWITPVFAEGATGLIGMSLLYLWVSKKKFRDGS